MRADSLHAVRYSTPMVRGWIGSAGVAIGVLTVASSSLPAQPVSGGLKLWLKADAITGLADGANVGTWVDSSGNGLDLSPSGAPPTWHAAVLNGQPVVRFAGNNAMSKTGVSGASFTSSDQATVFLVMLQNSADVFNSAYGWGDGSNRFVLHATFDDLLSFQHGVSGGTGGVVQPGSWDNLYHLLEMYRSVSQAEIMIDGVMSFQTSPPGGTLNTNAISIFFLGTDQFGNTLTGDIAELLVYNRVLAIEERCQVAAYLGSKYGLPYGVGRCDCNNNGRPDGQDVHVADGGPCTTPPDPLPAFCTMQPAAPECNCSDDCNLNGVPDECEPDCNDNGVPDSCEPNEEDRDCDGDGVCNGVQIVGCPPNTPSCADCNANGIQNSCEIATGAPDCNANGIPDECDSFQQIVYVNASATGANNGESWADAFVHLQSAIALASSCGTAQQIWVARGTYMPDGGRIPFGGSHTAGNLSQSATFNLINGVAIYGGFPNTGNPALIDRNPTDNPTILSGDLKSDDLPGFNNYVDNSHHIVTLIGTMPPTTLDGFRVYHADARSSADYRGAGLNYSGTGLTIRACYFQENIAGMGGAIHNAGALSIANCIIDGNQASNVGEGVGGGIRNATGSSLTITDCTLVNNRSAIGGDAIRNDAAVSITIDNCTFSGNAHTGSVFPGVFGDTVGSNNVGTMTITRSMFMSNGASPGATVACNTGGTVVITDSQFLANGAGIGGGIRLNGCSTTRVTRCEFRENQATDGGAIRHYSLPSATTIISECTFTRNAGGSALFVDGGSPSIINCVFQGNNSSSDGGAIHFYSPSTALIMNCVFSDNRCVQNGGAVKTKGDVRMINCTICRNHAGASGSGIQAVDGNPFLSSCVIWDNTGAMPQVGINNSSPNISHSDVQGGWTGTGISNVDLDPLFKRAPGPGQDTTWWTSDDDYGDLRIQSGSPCIDTGDSTSVPADMADLDNDSDTAERTPFDLAGNWRFQNDAITPDTGLADPPDYPAVVDMGAYEFSRPDCDGNGIPDECDASCAAHGGACQTAYPTQCGQITDCNGNNIPDTCDIPGGVSFDCDGNGIPDECEAPPNTTLSLWVGGVACATLPAVRECWSDAANWCPDTLPDNSGGQMFEVTIPTVLPASTVTLDISPTINLLDIDVGAAIEVNDASGANVRTLAVDGPITNLGILRATDGERLVIDAPLINQLDVNPDCMIRAGGLLEATDGVFNDPSNPDSPTAKSILEINGSVVLGGHARTIGANSEIHLIGGAELIDVCVEGVIVPDGQAGGFAGTIINSGRLGIAPAGAAFAVLAPMGSNETLEGDGGDDDSVTLGGQAAARLGDFKAAFTNAANHRIDGAGIIFGGMTNMGVVDANRADAQHLIIFPPGLKVNDGMLRATNGGVLRIADNITGSGNILAMGGRVIVVPGVSVLCDDIDVPPGSVSHLDIGVSPPGAATVTASNLNITGGIVNIAGGSIVTLTGTASVCPAASPPGSVAELHLNNATLNAGNLDICDGGVLTVASSITLSGSFSNAMTDGTATPDPAQSHWSWAAGSSFVMSGGQSPNLTAGSLMGWARLEAASDDAGPSGGTNNFRFANIVLTAGAHVSLVDFNANGTSSQGEAVYCENLNLGSGSVLNLNGLSLYRSQPTPQQVTPGPLDGGTVIDEPRGISGDCSGDGVMSEADLDCFIEVLLELDTNPAHVLLTDLNSDGVVDGRDVQVFVTNVLGG